MSSVIARENADFVCLVLTREIATCSLNGGGWRHNTFPTHQTNTRHSAELQHKPENLATNI